MDRRGGTQWGPEMSLKRHKEQLLQLMLFFPLRLDLFSNLPFCGEEEQCTCCRNQATYCNLHAGVGARKKQLSRPRSVLFIFHSTSAKFDSMSDISFHEKKKHTHTPANTERRLWDLGVEGGGGHCQLRGSRPCGGSLDLVFNLAVLNPGRQAKVTEQ